MVDKKETTSQFLQNRIKKFSRVEKAFYLSIAFTALVLAVSIIFMQTRFDKNQCADRGEEDRIR